MSDTEDIAIVEGSGNVFADMGMENPEEELAKAQLVEAITLAIRSRGLTQYQAARILGVDQPKVSALVRGRFGGFSIERLIRFLLALDRDVVVQVKPKPADRPNARLEIVA